MLRRLRPVGEPIDLRATSAGRGSAVDAALGYSFVPLGSGTSALAVALSSLRKRNAVSNANEVLIPAYGCPEIVAAVCYAGLEPRVIDTQRDCPFYAHARLCQAITSRTFAILAVDFLGIRENIEALRLLADANEVWLVEDAAQWIPMQNEPLLGDLTVWSFGRGKPVSLLGGGGITGLTARESEHIKHLKACPKHSAMPGMITAAVYNAALSSVGYGLVSRLPGLRLGTTVFRPLKQATSMSRWRYARLGNQLEQFKRASPDQRARQTHLADMLARHAPALDPVIDVRHDSRHRLLRFPVLCPTPRSRDHLLRLLQRRGIVATSFYNRALPDITGIQPRLRATDSPEGARHFADHLLTLPVHSGLRTSWCRRMLDACTQWQQAQ